jgi:hypothetical protein
MGENEALDAHEAGAAGERGRHRRRIGAGKDLNAKRQCGGAPEFSADYRHGRRDFRTHVGFQVGPVVRVLDQHAVEARILVHTCLVHGHCQDGRHIEPAGRSSRQRLHVHDANQGARDAKESVDDVLPVHQVPRDDRFEATCPITPFSTQAVSPSFPPRRLGRPCSSRPCVRVRKFVMPARTSS